MPDAAQKLTLIAELLGDKEVVANLQKIIAAQQGVAGSAGAQAGALGAAGEAIRDAATATGEAADKQEEHTLRLKDFTRVLQMIDPGLASMALRLGRTAIAFGDLGQKAIDFKSVGGGLLEVLGKFGPSLALFGAGSAVVLGIGAITSAWTKMGEEVKKVTEAIKAQGEAMNEVRRKEGEDKQAIEDISDARRRGGFDADTARKAELQARRVKESTPALKEAAVQTAAGNLGDAGLSDEEMAIAAALVQMGDLRFTGKESAVRAENKFRGQAEAKQQKVKRFFERERKQRLETAEQAAREMRTQEGSDLAIEDIAKRALGTGTPDAELKEAIEQAKKSESVEGLEKSLVTETAQFSKGDRFLGTIKERRAPTPTEAQAMKVLQALHDQRTRAEGATTIHYYDNRSNVENNAKNIVPGAAAQQRARVNGESAVRQLERIW